MSSHNVVVPPYSWDQLAELTGRIRQMFRYENNPFFPVVSYLEFVLSGELFDVILRIQPRSEMKEYEGLTHADGKLIELREDVYEAACNGDGRARFTVAHEIGHWYLHTGEVYPRVQPKQHVPVYRLSEPQANQFAAELLMPRKFIIQSDTAEDIMERHGVSFEAARNRINFMRRKVWS